MLAERRKVVQIDLGNGDSREKLWAKKMFGIQKNKVWFLDVCKFFTLLKWEKRLAKAFFCHL